MPEWGRHSITAAIAMACAVLLMMPSVVFGQDDPAILPAVDSTPTGEATPTAESAVPGEPELWSPVDLADIPFTYTCAGRPFHAVDLEEAPLGFDVEPPIPSGGRIVYRDASDAMTVTVRDPRRNPLEGAAWYTKYERSADGWRATGFGDCEPWARFPKVEGLGGYWRLDPSKPAPSPASRRLHLKVWYDRRCPSAVRILGRPRVHPTSEAVLIAVPVRVRIHTDVCVGGPPERITVRLPEPLGNRQLYDAGVLPIRPVGTPAIGNAAPSANGVGPWGPLAVIDDPGVGGLDAAGGSGRLRIGKRCVFLRRDDGHRTTLVWRSGQIRWDSDRGQIIFDDPDLGKVRLGHGDRLAIGGAAIGEGPYTAPAWMAEPDAACPDEEWVIDQVDPQG